MDLVIKLIGVLIILVIWWVLFKPKQESTLEYLERVLHAEERERKAEEIIRKSQRYESLSQIVDSRKINSKERIDLIKNVGDTWAIKLQPYGMYWHLSLKKFVVYTDPSDFNKNCVLDEGAAFDCFYGCDLLCLNNRTVETETLPTDC